MEFLDIQIILDGIDPQHNASELHGLVCGYQCAGSRWQKEDWYKVLDDWFAVPALPADLHQKLAPVAAESLKQLASEELSFNLILPPSDQALSLRTIGMTSWSRGFLAGFGLSGKYQEKDLSADVAEFLHDLAAISQMDEQVDDDGEADFYEVEEYIRMGVLLIFTECGEPQVH